jgi:hypothetical protein
MLITAEVVPALARDFPGFEFRSVVSWRGRAVEALRRAGVEAGGLYVIITSDMDELRSELAAATP